MKKVILWFFLCCKRYLKRIPFLLLLAALPLTALAASRMENRKDGTVRIAVCCLDPEPASLGNRLKENLLARDTGLFSFYPCENEQQVRDHVAARKAECGYLIPENLEQKINSGRFKRSITVFSAPSTVTASLSTEVVFSELAAIRNKDILEDYVEQAPPLTPWGLQDPRNGKRPPDRPETFIRNGWRTAVPSVLSMYTRIRRDRPGTAPGRPGPQPLPQASFQSVG